MIATRDTLTDALSEALETMAFLSTGPVDDQTIPPDVAVLTEMRFQGPRSGSIQILSGLSLGRIVAQNIGSLDEVDDQAAVDAWRELCNVTCGLVIPRIAASTAEVYDVTVPSVRTGEGLPSWDQFVAQSDTHVLNVEGYAAAVRLTINP